MSGPPWRTRCDFGDRITPHELAAVAYDADGVEMHRARQVVNLPRPPAEVKIVFETGEDQMPLAARMIWESAEDAKPLSAFLLFDGRVLIPESDGRYTLPSYDPNQVHIVTGEVRFPNEISARSDVTFGGWYGSKVNTELTAVPIIVGDEPPEVVELSGVFTARGRPLRVAAVEKNRAQVFLVRDYATMAAMVRTRAKQERTSLHSRSMRRELGTVPPKPDEDRVHVVVPNPLLRNNRQLFPTSPGVGLGTWPLPWLATHLTGDGASLKGQKIADAVAVAAFRAAGDGSPRAVLAIVTDDASDWSAFEFSEVRSYLRDLRVPLYVWYVGEALQHRWAPATEVSTHRALSRASKRLLKDLDRQWVVWVEGSHMINEIELADSISSVALAGVQ
jgi:hypothetical protein